MANERSRNSEHVPIEVAKNGAAALLERLNGELERGVIGEGDWYREVAAVLVPAYLAAEDPRGQSGSSGGKEDWRYKRSLLAEGFDRDGTFLDVGCASGHLMVTMVGWCAERGVSIEPYGLDISPELVALARGRLPHWAGRIWVGNGIDWVPARAEGAPKRFDFARVGLEYVPPRRQLDLVEHLLTQVVAPGGRLIVGVYSEERDDTRVSPSEEERVSAWGFKAVGRTQRPHRTDGRLVYRAFWIEAPAA